MPSIKHEQAVAKIVAEHKAETTLFRKKVSEAVKDEHILWLRKQGYGKREAKQLAKMDLEMPHGDCLNLHPDAFKIYTDTVPPKLVIWEVETSNLFKADKYSRVFWWLDQVEWELELIAVHTSSGATTTLEGLSLAFMT